MSLSAAAFDDLRSHWAVSAIGADRLERAHTLVRERLARRAVGKQIAFSFAADEEHDTSFLERVALAYELAMIEGLDELSRPSGTNDALRDQAVAAAFHGFDVRRVLPVPRETEDRLFFVLQISAAAYCGDRWSDLRRWYQENEAALTAPSRRGGIVGTAACSTACSTAGSDCSGRTAGTIWIASARLSRACATISEPSKRACFRTTTPERRTVEWPGDSPPCITGRREPRSLPTTCSRDDLPIRSDSSTSTSKAEFGPPPPVATCVMKSSCAGCTPPDAS